MIRFYRKQEPVEVRMRALWCDFCEEYRMFDAGNGWFHCSTCKKCFTCLNPRTEKCQKCIEWEGQDKVAERRERRLAMEEKKQLKAKDLMAPIQEEVEEDE